MASTRRSALAALLAATVLPLPATVRAQASFTRPVRAVVPFPAGGPTDGVARLVLQAAAAGIGQPVIVENRPGAEGAIAAQAVAAAPPDGHVLLVATSSVMALPATTKPEPFRAEDLVPVATLGRFAFGLFVHPELPVRTVGEFVVHARSHPGALNVATANLSEHAAALQFMKSAGVQLTRVPYKGAAQALPDLIAGRVHAYFTPLSAGIGAAKDGRLRLLGVATPARHPLAPEVPTLAEAGVAGVSVPSFQFLMAPARTPRELLDRLARSVAAALGDPELRQQLQARGLSLDADAAGGAAALLAQSTADYAAIAREVGVAP